MHLSSHSPSQMSLPQQRFAHADEANPVACTFYGIVDDELQGMIYRRRPMFGYS